MATRHSSLDGYVYKTTTTGFSDTREATAGSLSDTTIGSAGAFASITQVKAGPGRFNSTNYSIYRSFYRFDVSDLNNVDRVKILIRGYSANSGRTIFVKSTQGSTLSTADFDAITGWVNDEDNENNVTTYSDLISDSSWSTTSTNVITLNDQALEDIRNNDFFQCALINYDYDLKDSDPGGTSYDYATGGYYSKKSDGSNSSYRPYLSYTELPTDMFLGFSF